VPVIHARIFERTGLGIDPDDWLGERRFEVVRTEAGDTALACGKSLHDVHRETPFAWMLLRSRRSQAARHVTCPACVQSLERAGYLHVRPASP